jgi:hypothetical protein
MKLVPLPHDMLDRTEVFWMPYLLRSMEFTTDPLVGFLAQIRSGDVQVILIWDEENKKAMAACGVRVLCNGDTRTFDVVWLGGGGLSDWEHLIWNEFEHYAREHRSCTHARFTGRPGWRRVFKGHGYKVTHVTMKKEL